MFFFYLEIIIKFQPRLIMTNRIGSDWPVAILHFVVVSRKRLLLKLDLRAPRLRFVLIQEKYGILAPKKD